MEALGVCWHLCTFTRLMWFSRCSFNTPVILKLTTGREWVICFKSTTAYTDNLLRAVQCCISNWSVQEVLNVTCVHTVLYDSMKMYCNYSTSTSSWLLKPPLWRFIFKVVILLFFKTIAICLPLVSVCLFYIVVHILTNHMNVSKMFSRHSAAFQWHTVATVIYPPTKILRSMEHATSDLAPHLICIESPDHHTSKIVDLNAHNWQPTPPFTPPCKHSHRTTETLQYAIPLTLDYSRDSPQTTHFSPTACCATFFCGV